MKQCCSDFYVLFLRRKAARYYGGFLCVVVLLTVSSVVLSLGTPADAQPVITWVDSIEVASGGGQRGAWQQNESKYDYVDDPTVAADARGDAAVSTSSGNSILTDMNIRVASHFFFARRRSDVRQAGRRAGQQ